MGNFLLNVFASIIGSTLLIAVTGILSKKARWVLIGLLSRLLNVDLDYLYRDRKEVEQDLVQDLKSSLSISILTGRGSEFNRDTFAPLFAERPSSRKLCVRLLLPATIATAGVFDWTKQREGELASFDPAYGTGLLAKQIEANASFLQKYVESGIVEIRRFEAPHIGRIVLTDRFAYFTPYRRDAHGRHSPVYKSRRGGDMYDNFIRFFEQLWEAASTHDTSEAVQKLVRPSSRPAL